LAFSSNRTSKKTGFPQSGREQEENAIAAAARQKEPLRKKKGEKKYVINLVLVIICLRLVFRNNDAFLHFFRCKTKLSILKSSGALLCENISVWICPRLKNKKILFADACKKKFNRVRIIFDRPILVVSQRDTYSIGCYCCCCCGRRLLDKQYYARFNFFLKKRKTIY
jgi:hypothetical protein